ncbi:hypothetical protein [Phaeobacter sp. HF9A]|uniref:COG4315 family predicted lipoprotein n=1 Tax=Phaeobacter sp. HF9A TaxID=2721561 RepID=UPI00142FF509|nr:hypothetical protein [Phaeobacter sp. HF9A]NIZ14105.1 hypothetical protein [Phaeobacter sp. HF9A]
MTRFSILAAGFILAAGSAFAGTAVVETSEAGYLTDGAGMTLYSFDKDSDGTSNCYDGCAAKWPPLVVEGEATLPEGFALTERKDGSQQVSYMNQPLYLWVGDKAAGQTSGDGVGGVWHIVKP